MIDKDRLHRLRRRVVAIAMLMHEMDWPDIISWEHASGAYDHPASTGEHSGDCTNEAHTCLRCERDRLDAKADEVLTRLALLDAIWAET